MADWMKFEFFMNDAQDAKTREYRAEKGWAGYGPTSIDLNTIVGIEPPVLFKAEPDYGSERKEDVVLARVYTNWAMGRGINGVSNVFYISEKDYKRLLTRLDIPREFTF